MNFTGLETMLHSRLGFTDPNTNAVTNTRLRSFLNETHREILGMKGLSRLRRNLLTFACTANSPYVVLPQAVNRIIAITDRVNNWELVEVLLGSIRQGDPGLTMSTSYPDRFAILNLAAANALEPSAAAELFVKSDSATDGATKTAFLEGIVTGGSYRTASVNLNGVTAASFSASITTWIAITKFYLSLAAGGSTSAVGNVTINQGSGAGTELARITPGRSYARYTRIQLYPTPTAANTYYADCELHVEEMANGGDEPLLPEEFHWLLSCGALMKEYQRRQWSVQFNEEAGRFNRGVGDLLIAVNRRTAGLSEAPRRFSQLGPYFPPGS